MIEKTRKKQQCPYMQRNCIQGILSVLVFNFLLFFTTNMYAQQCGNVATHVAEFDIDADCAAATTVTHAVTPGLTYNLVVDPNITYTFTICDDVAGADQPYAELWDGPGATGNFLMASTLVNGCATITHSNCTPIQDYTIAIYTQHGTTNFCETDGGGYSLTSTCTSNAYTCPAATSHVKLNIDEDNSCCYTGMMPVPDLSAINCQNTATFEYTYVDCTGASITLPATLPDADNMIPVSLPYQANSSNIQYTVTIDGVAVTCHYPVTVTKGFSCLSNSNVSLNADCNGSISSSAFTNQTCGADPYEITFTVNGAQVPELTSEYLGFTNIQAITTAPNGNTCSTTIKLMDALPPKFTSCPADITLTCGQSTDVADTGMATATDCSGIDGEVSFIDSSVSVPNCGGKVITRTFFATDTNGQTGSCQQVITLEPIDVTAIVPPSHYIDADETGSNEMVLSCADYSTTNLPGIDVTGGLEINGTVLAAGMSCDYMITMSDEVIPICGGSFDIIRSWEITNWCNPTADPVEFDQYIKVMDSEGPVGTAGTTSFLNSNNSCLSTVTVETATWTDACSALSANAYTVTLTGSGTSFSTASAGAAAVFPNVPYGLYNVTWCARDECDNQGCVSSAITLSDNTNPVAFCENREIVLNASNNYAFSFCANLLDDGSQDNCGSVDLLIKETADATAAFTECVDLGCSNISAPVNLTLQVTDNSGNVATVDCDVTVVLGEPVCPTFTTVEINCNEDPTAATGWGEYTYANVSDCNLSDFVVTDLIDITDVCGPTTVLQTWTSEMSGLACTQMVRINPLLWDNTSFVAPVDVTLECSNVADVNDIQEAEIEAVNPAALLNIDKSNNCYPSQVLDGVLEKTLFSSDGCESIVLKTYKIIDQCLFTGNLASPVEGEAGFYTYTQTITVADNTAPVFEAVPEDFTVECTFQLPTNPTATDNCGTATVSVDATSLGTPDAFGNYSTAPGTYAITYTATDGCVNSTTTSVNVTVNSTEPVLTCLLNSTTNIDLGTTCSRTLNANEIFSATDVCNVGVDMTVQIVTDPNNLPTTMPTTTSVTFDASHIGEVQVQIWASVSGTVFGPQYCTFNITDENCLCTDGVTFNVTGSNSTGLNCSYDATITDLNTTDYTVVWESNSACDGSLTCNYDAPGIYTVTVTDNVTGCSTTESVELVAMNIGLGTQFDSPCQLTFENIVIDGVTITDFTGYTINLEFDGAVIQTITEPNTVITGAVNGSYIINLTTPNGCQFQETVMTCSNLRIGGVIANEEGEQVDDVTVKISDAIDPIVTGETGTYLFEEVTAGSNYTVTPSKNLEPLNGVSTLDLVLISKHILGIELLDSPYKLIAADANNTGTITTLDLVKIQRLILGLDDDFAPLDSWCFVDAGFTFPDVENPFQTTIPEIYPINNFNGEMIDIDFVGVKVGDVNGTATANSLLQSAVRNYETLDLEVQNQQFDRGEEFEVNFTSESFDAILGFQYTFQFDNQAMEFVTVKSAQLKNLNEDNFGLSKVEGGLITASWFTHDETSMKANDVLFTLVFKGKQRGDLSTAFHITSGITKNEIYSAASGAIETAAVNLNVNGAIDKVEEVTLFQNSPNPFTASTTIQFYLPEADQASILIFDYSGKLITEINREFEKGMNEILIDKAMLNTTGVLFYQLETQQFTATKKMLLIK